MRRPLAAIGIAVTLTLAGCSRAPHAPAASSVTEATLTVSATSAPPTLIATGPWSSPATPSSAVTVLDGVYDCYIRSIDRRGGGALRVVFATVFRGAEAQQAAQQADEQLPPGVNSYVRVDDPQERKLPLRGLKPPDQPNDGVYRITVRGGVVVSFAEEDLR